MRVTRRGLIAGGLTAGAIAAAGSRAGGEDSRSGFHDRFESLFGRCNRPGSPGICFAGLENGEVVFREHYGHAEIEFGAPITSHTVFHAASISKQFTGLSIALLEREGRIDLDAEVRRYLPWVPDYGGRLTVRHLVHNVGGLHDTGILLLRIGRDWRDFTREQHFINIISRQRSLDFPPGTEYLYSNDGHVLLGEIVKAVSGTTLRRFVQDNILEPLGMERTLFYDDITELVPQRAQSYRRRTDDAGWDRAPLNTEYVGATNLNTTLDDFIKWARNFFRPVVGDAALLQHIVQPGSLTDGSKVNYAYGLTRARLAGHELVMHTGSDAGYSAIITHHLASRRSLVMLANMAAEPRSTAEDILNVWFNDDGGSYQRPTPKALLESSADIIGSYLEPFGRMVTVARSQAGLVWREAAAPDAPIVTREDGSFDLGGARRWIYVPRRDAGRVVAIEEHQTDEFMPRVAVWPRVEPATPSRADLEELVGDYRNDEVDITFRVTVEEGRLVARTIWTPRPIRLVPGPKGQFDADVFLVGSFVVERDARGTVNGFTVTSYWARNFKIRRLPAAGNT